MDRTFATLPPSHTATWESVATDGRAATDRAAVPGGWLYRATAYSSDAEPIAVSICFVPDTALAPVPDAGAVAV